ncbi:glycoside hydrolase family 6 protein [Streptomyces sp. WMMC940]|uniref:glycoside hydrolase family 6 protein n=1 Tax=Streptomyces sp. WMMC940 TaxID=3015153 RepID=UPI0022B65A57|nr:glycoside hydrolase family 6 protein [Streptomyces sp. WMMC940]MCZ7461495.1 glycoside hydrolase family 6 protein [Streptomyces sp. WMMC940]
MSGVRNRRRAERQDRRLAAGRGVMAAAASAVVALGTVAGLVSTAGRGGEDGTARPEVRSSPVTVPLPARPSRTPSAPEQSPAPSPSPAAPAVSATPSPKSRPTGGPRTPAAAGRLYRHPQSQVLDWVREHRDDPRRPLIESRIAAHPAAVWFPEYDPGRIAGRVRAVTSGAAASGRVPVLVPYAIPDRDCGGASRGGAPDLAAYDAWIRQFAAGLGDGPVIVVLEPDSIALADCLADDRRAARYGSLARAARTLKAANPRARVYFDAGHSGWHPVAKQAAELRAAGAATSGDGIFTNVSNFHGTAEEARYARRVLDALGGPPGLGAVIDTSRNGNGAPRRGAWCDPAGRALGRAPTTGTGEARIDAYLWVKLPGESDGCRGAAGTFTPDYAYDLATG